MAYRKIQHSRVDWQTGLLACIEKVKIFFYAHRRSPKSKLEILNTQADSLLKQMPMSRKNPNIIITGTPGVGKTSHCHVLAENTGLKHLLLNQLVKDKSCHEGWSEEFQSYIVDEDKVCLLFS